MSPEETENVRRGVIAKAVSLVFIDIVAIAGNILVCLSVYKNRRLRTKTGILILFLAISDLMFAATVVPMSTASIWMTDPLTNDPVWISKDTEGIECAIHGMLMYSLTGLSVSTMAFAAVNRYFCIAHSNFYRKYFTYRMICTTLLLMFMSIVILLICLVAPGYGTFAFFGRFAQCMLKFKPRYLPYLRAYVEMITLTIWGLIPFITIIVFYLLIFFYVRRHNRRIGCRLAKSSKPANVTITEVTSGQERTPNLTNTGPNGQEVPQKDNTAKKEIKFNHEMANTYMELSNSNTETTKQPPRQHNQTLITQQSLDSTPLERNSSRNTNFNSNIRTTKSEIKIAKILLAVFLGFCICWIPTLISHVINIASNYTREDVTIMSLFSVSLSTAINPFIYGVGNREFRKTYINLLTCKTFV